MRAVVARDNQPVIVNLRDLTPNAGEILIGVKATALNRADILLERTAQVAEI
jgi:NADPH:quinone reductase-like Zn-dependent oxidoreductase